MRDSGSRFAACLLAMAVLLAGCGGGDQPIGGLSADEAAQLNNAAEMLDAGAPPTASPATGAR